jgi:hypothetical protein
VTSATGTLSFAPEANANRLVWVGQVDGGVALPSFRLLELVVGFAKVLDNKGYGTATGLRFTFKPSGRLDFAVEAAARKLWNENEEARVVYGTLVYARFFGGFQF